jgi:tetrapyrrole methylase family protein/MazG family protein
MICNKEQVATAAIRMVETIERLRAPNGCPWDREQTHASLKECLVEECAELLDDIDDGNFEGMLGEIGDVMLNVVMQAVIAAESDKFDFVDVMNNLTDKLIRRHPHVFGNAQAANPDEVKLLWDAVKKEENNHTEKSIMPAGPRNVSALLAARKIQRKAAKYNFDWRDQNEIIAKIHEELDEVKQAIAAGDEAETDREIGDLLFAVVNLARFRERQPAEDLLRNTIRKFIQRFRYIEKQFNYDHEQLKAAGIDRLEALWQQAKNFDQ